MLFTKLFSLRQDWFQFFQDTDQPDPLYSPKTFTSRPTTQPSSSNTYIYQCGFSGCSSSDGGAIYHNKDIKFLVEFCFFRECRAASNGGALNIENGDFVCNRVCFYKCFASQYGQDIRTSLSDNKQNTVIESSICSDLSTNGQYSTIYLISGYKNCTFVNVSKNKVTYYYSAIRYDSGSSDSIIAYCSLNSNEATGSTCVYISSGDSLTVQNSNIISNKQGSYTSAGTFECYRNTNIKGCCLLDNNASRLFYAYSSYTITVTNCTLPADGEYSAYGKVTTSHARTHAPFIYDIKSRDHRIYCFVTEQSQNNIALIVVPLMNDVSLSFSKEDIEANSSNHFLSILTSLFITVVFIIFGTLHFSM